MMDSHWQTGLDILRASCALPEVLDIVVPRPQLVRRQSKHRQERVGEQMPLGARMLAIVDAFDAMLSDHVVSPRAVAGARLPRTLPQYRHAIRSAVGGALHPSCSRANSFSMQTVARRWLQELDPETVNSHWRRSDKPRWANSASRGHRLAVSAKTAGQYVGRRGVSR